MNGKFIFKVHFREKTNIQSNIFRAFFFVSFVLVVLLSFYYIGNVYEKWTASPVIVTMGAISTSITDLPFPAVTICNINKGSLLIIPSNCNNKIYKAIEYYIYYLIILNPARESVVKKFKNGSTEAMLLENVCYDEYANVSIQNEAVSRVSSEWSVFKQFLVNISQPCHEMLLLCRYALETFKCMELFDTVLSDEGTF